MEAVLRRFVTVFVAIAAHAQLCWGETAIFTCYNSDDSCDKQFVKYEYPEYNVNDAIKRCCLEFNGISYVSTESSEGCSQCIVYGFFQSSAPNAKQVTSATFLEGDQAATDLSFGVVRGNPPSPRGFVFGTVDITTDTKDYILPKRQFQIFDQKVKPIGLVVIDDHVALEGSEEFKIRPTSSLAVNEFIQSLTVSITDINVVLVQFSESEYSVVEGRSPAIVTVERVGAIARSLEVSLTPLTFMQFLNVDSLPEAKGLVPAKYSLLGEKDFDGSQQMFIFPPGDAAVWATNVSITVFDDKTNEADKGFVVALEIVSQEWRHEVDTTEQNITVVRIINDDALFVGFVNTSLMTPEGKVTKICLRILDPPTSVTIGVHFRLKISLLQTSGLRHIISPTAVTSDIFNNTVREWCVDVSTNDNNAYEKPESVVFAASLVNTNVGALTAARGEASGADLVIVSPNATTLSIVNVDTVRIGFAQQELSVFESRGSVLLNIVVLSGKIYDPINLNLKTIDNTAFAGTNYVQREMDFPYSGGMLNTSIQILVTSTNGPTKCFTAVLSLVDREPLVDIRPDTAKICITKSLFVGFVNTSVIAPEGKVTKICLRIMDPPTSVTFSADFRLKISLLQISGLRHTISPTAVTSDIFNSTVREWCIDVSINVNNAYEKAESVVFKASLASINVGALTAGRGASGVDLVVVSPNAMTLTIVNVDAVRIGWAQQELSVFESRGSVVLSIVVLSGMIYDPINLHLKTVDNTAVAGTNYVQREMDFSYSGGMLNTSIQILVTSTNGSPKCFTAVLSLVDRDPLVDIRPDTVKICIMKTSSGIWITDKVTDDPLFMVHLASTSAALTPLPSLCYEVFGKPNSIFNMVSTPCMSLNALYSPLDDQRNIISALGLLVVDTKRRCTRIQVSADDCTPVVDGVHLSSQYDLNGVTVTWLKGLVNVGTPNCGYGNTIVSISCSAIDHQSILSLAVSRQLGDTHLGHGLLGQFWNASLATKPYTGIVPVEFGSENLHLLNITPAQSTSRKLLGSKFDRSWDFTETTCYYCGNIQGGRSDSIGGSYNDPVIEGEYVDYITEGIFSPRFKFSKFAINQCS